jgi:hypothetical protein
LIELFLELLVGGFAFRFLALIGPDLGREFLQDGIGFHFLLHQSPQLEQRRLKNEQTLLELRSENLLERQVLGLVHSGASH